MEKDLFEGWTIEEMSHTLAAAEKLEPGTKEHSQAIEDIKKLAEIQIENEKAAEELNIKRDELKAAKLKNYMDFGKSLIVAGFYVGTGVIMLKYNLKEGSLQGKDASKWFDQLKTIIKH